ncbi:hypothetical protein HN789_05905 [archaeon]|jgi:hypothetical protein|nr:hypothetical protein [archaeon]MBT4022308.1 hypothetical protein [archaeon]MBT4271735.1 hypothetical protein [archaeon]MBT4461379.1 hypothetical protein [archaeon]MBT4858634.1 hypothetical protein [archaeon]
MSFRVRDAKTVKEAAKFKLATNIEDTILDYNIFEEVYKNNPIPYRADGKTLDTSAIRSGLMNVQEGLQTLFRQMEIYDGVIGLELN